VVAKYTLAALACLFLGAGAVRGAREGNFRHPRTRTWLTIGIIFALVSAWLFS